MEMQTSKPYCRTSGILQKKGGGGNLKPPKMFLKNHEKTINPQNCRTQHEY